jgi:hypothetical protein
MMRYGPNLRGIAMSGTVRQDISSRPPVDGLLVTDLTWLTRLALPASRARTAMAAAGFGASREERGSYDHRARRSALPALGTLRSMPPTIQAGRSSMVTRVPPGGANREPRTRLSGRIREAQPNRRGASSARRGALHRSSVDPCSSTAASSIDKDVDGGRRPRPAGVRLRPWSRASLRCVLRGVRATTWSQCPERSFSTLT